MQKCRSAEVQKCRSAEVQKCRSEEVLKCRIKLCSLFLLHFLHSLHFLHARIYSNGINPCFLWYINMSGGVIGRVTG